MPAPPPLTAYAAVLVGPDHYRYVPVIVPGGHHSGFYELVLRGRGRGTVVLHARRTGSRSHVEEACKRPAAELRLDPDALVPAVIAALEWLGMPYPYEEPKGRVGRPPGPRTDQHVETPRTTFPRGDHA